MHSRQSGSLQKILAPTLRGQPEAKADWCGVFRRFTRDRIGRVQCWLKVWTSPNDITLIGEETANPVLRIEVDKAVKATVSKHSYGVVCYELRENKPNNTSLRKDSLLAGLYRCSKNRRYLYLVNPGDVLEQRNITDKGGGDLVNWSQLLRNLNLGID
ncbi:hypothetical protein J6590_051752 [Homalodisca vitripennis]|nr:hypothetical protein J6590_051752 [Homalodisca vitripennis]